VEASETNYDRILLARSDLGLGHPAAALGEARDITGWIAPFVQALADHELGHDTDAARDFAALKQDMGDNGAMQYAEIFAQWGRIPDALAWLKKAVQMRDPGLVLLREDFMLDPIRATQDFQDIERGLKYPS
jgi:hypothetical protein